MTGVMSTEEFKKAITELLDRMDGREINEMPLNRIYMEFRAEIQNVIWD